VLFISCRSERIERVAVSLLLAIVLGLFIWIAHFRLDPLDEGYFIYTSSRVLAGELPYRDFATPYTPGFFYLNALLFRIFGMDVLTLRLSLVVARISLLLLVYLLGRRIMPPAFAALPVLFLLIVDQAPGGWESHPAWWSTAALLIAVWCVCRHLEQGRNHWWLAAGLAAGASFAFKQNLGLFALLALLAAALCYEQELPEMRAPSWLARLRLPLSPSFVDSVRPALGPLSLIMLCLVTAFGIRQHLSPLLFAMFCAPFAALALERLGGVPTSPVSASTRVRLSLATASFGLVTLSWLLPLALALGPEETPFAAFVGSINPAGYYLPLEPPRPGLGWVLGLWALGLFLVIPLCRRWPRLLKAGMGFGALALSAGLLHELLRPAAEVDPHFERAAVLLTVQATTNLALYLPALAFWSAYVMLVTRRVPANHSFYLRWYLLAGVLLLLNQYPRMDEVHLQFSAPLLWIAGAYAIWRLYARITRRVSANPCSRLGRCVAYVALVGLPFAAAWPMLLARLEALLVPAPDALLGLAPPRYVPVGLPGASVLETEEFASKYQRLAAYFRQHSRADDPIFVYPAAPLLYYLLDRPNATRFNHLLPGLLSAEEEGEAIERLGSVPASYVVWDSFGADYWGRPGVYQHLTDYIWDNYAPVESIGGFEVMRRKAH
jgi:hypothetical protein